MKVVKAVAPYHHPGFLNFKEGPFLAWEALGGKVANNHYPWRWLHGLAYRWELPTLWRSKKEARLRFVTPVSISFDTFPDYALYEIIPLVWDCWPCYFDKMCAWLKKHNVRTAIFTSSQVATFIKERFPSMNILTITEGLDEKGYYSSGPIQHREYDILEYGREIDHVVKYCLPDTVKYIHGKVNGKNVFTPQQLYDALANSKIVMSFPKSMTDPKESGGMETLTQRYWEGLFSGALLVGHAPQELVDLLGYNPVIEVDLDNCNAQMMEILKHIGDYQPLVDKNKEMAMKYGRWEYSMQRVIDFLQSKGYEI